MSQSVILYRDDEDVLLATKVEGPGRDRKDTQVVEEFLDDPRHEGCTVVGYILFDAWPASNDRKSVYLPEITEKVVKVERSIEWPSVYDRPVSL